MSGQSPYQKARPRGRSSKPLNAQRSLQGVFRSNSIKAQQVSQEFRNEYQKRPAIKIVLVQRGSRKNKDGKFVPSMNEVYSEDDEELDHASSPEKEDSKRSKNAYFQFRSDPIVKERYLSGTIGQEQCKIVQKMSEEWNGLSDAQKLPYQQKAARAARAYKRTLQRSTQPQRDDTSMADESQQALGANACDHDLHDVRGLANLSSLNGYGHVLPLAADHQPIAQFLRTLHTDDKLASWSYDNAYQSFEPYSNLHRGASWYADPIPQPDSYYAWDDPPFDDFHHRHFVDTHLFHAPWPLCQYAPAISRPLLNSVYYQDSFLQ